jgi:hypothetical protein
MKSGKLAWAALGTVLAIDVAAAISVAPLATEAAGRNQARVLLDVGKTAARTVSEQVQHHATRLLGTGLIVLAKGAGRLYSAMLSVTATETAAPAEDQGCRMVNVNTVSTSARSGCAARCRSKAEQPATAPARYYSEVL